MRVQGLSYGGDSLASRYTFGPVRAVYGGVSLLQIKTVAKALGEPLSAFGVAGGLTDEDILDLYNEAVRCQ